RFAVANRSQLKSFILLFISLISLQINAQTAFEETFEDKENGLDLTLETEGYSLSQSQNYTGTVTAVVTESGGNKFARLNASPNGQARMEIVKTISVEIGTVYTYEIESKGPFKRQLRVYSDSGQQIAASPDYKPATDAEQTAWKKMAVTFLAESEEVQIAFHHYWSGTIDLDNLKVDEATRQSSYYISSSTGDDDNPGTKEAPLKSLEKLSTTTVFAGDSVLFKRGDRFEGHYVVNGSGSEDAPVLITGYGEGDQPILTGQVGAAGGGDYLEAILVENSDNLIFDGLEVRNDRTVPRSGVSDVDAFGINVRNTGAKVMNNLTFRNMTIRNVFAPQPILQREDFDKIQVSGLSFHSNRNTQVGQEKNINNILVENCLFANLQRLGIKFSHARANEGIGNDSINRNTNILIRNNEFSYNGGSAVLANGTYNCLIENNLFDHPGADTDPRMPARGSSVWNINAINTISQYNMCISTRGYLDSYGIHIDNSNVNTFVQYNYMYDCEGGFVEILRGNENAVYRFNVSVNSGFRQSSWERSNSTIYVYSDRWADGGLDLSDGIYIYNNTVVIDKPFTTSVFMDARNMFVYNNVFSSTNGAGMGAQNPKVFENGTPLFMKNNLFEGTVNET
ncbi:MAG: right-handed parallel beta-helix repeat-containing protein, partial [Bacteroidota bacterium]